MQDNDTPKQDIEPILAMLVHHHMEASLTLVEEALRSWRAGERDIATPHLETVRHAARMEALAARISRAREHGPESLLRDAFDLGFVSRERFVGLVGKEPEAVEANPPLDDEIDASLSRTVPKRAALEMLLEKGPVLLHLDARRSGVRVPNHLASDPDVILRIGYRLTPPIPDLTIDDEGVSATLTFRGVPYLCRLPWPAIYAITNEAGEGIVYERDIPNEVASRMRPHAPEEPDDTPPPKRPTGRHLKLVK